MTTKVCNKCKVEKDLDEFHVNRSSKDGKSGKCKECAILAVREWQKANPEKTKDRKRAWQKANQEKVRAAKAAWQKANPEKVSASQIAWRKRNPERVRAMQIAWEKANPEKRRAYECSWRKANPEKVKQIRQKFNRRQVNTLQEYYVANLMKMRLFNAPKELIELKRLQLQIHRELKQQGVK